MRIGILTFHRAVNFGAILQAYALQETIRGLGHECFIIDYRPEYIDGAYNAIRIFDWRHPRGTLNEILTCPGRILRKKYFRDFEKRHLKILKEDVENKLDCIVLGSDQIWYPPITGGRLDNVFFNVATPYSAVPAFAYAASTKRVDLYSDEDIKCLKAWLPKLVTVGIRERVFSEYLHQHCGVQSSVVLDPTLLADPNIFTCHLSTKSPEKNPYLLYFEMWHNEKAMEKARIFAKEKKLKFIAINNGDIRFGFDKTKQIVSPWDFLSYIKNADWIICNSFHGMAFSIIFKRQFNVVGERADSSRMLNVLDNIGLINRFSQIDESLEESMIDYNYIESILNESKTASIQFLKDSISSVNKK